jgi:hypothetical protein
VVCRIHKETGSRSPACHSHHSPTPSLSGCLPSHSNQMRQAIYDTSCLCQPDLPHIRGEKPIAPSPALPETRTHTGDGAGVESSHPERWVAPNFRIFPFFSLGIGHPFPRWPYSCGCTSGPAPRPGATRAASGWRTGGRQVQGKSGPELPW